MTNNFFDFKRFLCYLGKLWTEQRRTILFSAAILLGILFIIEMWTCLISYASIYEPEDGTKAYDAGKTALIVWGTLLLYTGACISATRIFTDGQQKAGRIHVLTMPVSMFENWLARTLLFAVGYFVVFHVIFYALEIMRYLLLSSAFPNVDIRIAHPVMWLGFGSNGLLNILLLIGGLTLLFFNADNNASFYILTAWVGLLGLVNLWLSYRRLCELEVIDRM